MSCPDLWWQVMNSLERYSPYSKSPSSANNSSGTSKLAFANPLVPALSVCARKAIKLWRSAATFKPEIKKHFSERKIVICREITKLYEEFLRTNVSELEQFQKEPKGELTVVISDGKTDENNSKNLNESDINIINKMINKLTIKEITDLICQNSKVSKKLVYNYCLKLKNEN